VATSVGGIAEIVGEEDGAIVPPGDPRALAAAIHDISSRHHGRDEIASRARARFGIKAVAEQMMIAYRSALG
jgi:glycosyltransferase involved in cell wall biosynthesis